MENLRPEGRDWPSSCRKESRNQEDKTMKTAIRRGLYAFVALVLAAGPRLFAASEPKDPLVKGVEELVAEYPFNVKLLFENDYVWVLEFRLRPGEMLPVHETGNRAVYALSGYRLLFLHSYEPSEESWQPGAVRWYHYEPHEVRNVGKTDARFLVVTRKPVPLGEAPERDPQKDLLTLAPQGSRLLLENQHMRIMKVLLRPGEKQPLHQGLHRVVYSLADYQIRMGGNEYQFHTGDVHFHGPGEHAVENTSQSWAQYVVFELRK
jgi:hypothetical protein